MENEILYDWKSASTWKVVYKDFDDWKKQGLTYAWLMKQHGLNVKKCRFVAMLKDHSKTDAKHKPDYPQLPVCVYEFDVTEADLLETSERIKGKVEQIVLAERPAAELACFAQASCREIRAAAHRRKGWRRGDRRGARSAILAGFPVHVPILFRQDGCKTGKIPVR